jgi:hypothetical protein
VPKKPHHPTEVCNATSCASIKACESILGFCGGQKLRDWDVTTPKDVKVSKLPQLGNPNYFAFTFS